MASFTVKVITTALTLPEIFFKKEKFLNKFEILILISIFSHKKPQLRGKLPFGADKSEFYLCKETSEEKHNNFEKMNKIS